MTIWQRVALCVAVGSAAADAAAQEEDSAAVSRSGGAGTAQQIPAPAGARQNTGVEISIDDGIEIKSADGDFSIKINGRLHADWARHEGESADAEAVDGTHLRRARIDLGGRFNNDWQWAAETDFAGNDVDVKDFWLGYRGLDAVDLTVGQQKQPYSLAVEMSSNDIPYVERGIDSQLVLPFVDRAIGVRADASGDHWFAATGLFGEAADPGDGADEGWGASGRFVYAPVIRDDRVVHLGIRAAHREPSATEPVRIHDQTTDFSDLHIVDTGPLTGVESATLYGPEAAFVVGRLSLFSEYNRLALRRRTAQTLDFDSWHVGAAWSIGGESRAPAYRIDSGEFKRLEAEQPFDLGHGGGTWEVSARYASIDLNDAGVAGGSEETFGLGANWYAGPNVRFLLDWTHVLDTDGSSAARAAAEGLDVVTLRAQFTF